MALFEAVQAAGGPSEHTAYLKTVARVHPSDFLRAGSLFELAREAKSKGDDEQFRQYHGRLLSQYPQSFHADRANEAFGENQRPAIEAGQPAPSFQVSAIGEDADVITPDSLEGSPYLIDFWASWCGPCLMEMDALHAVHERYEPEGLRMLSISLDESPVPVREIRSARWPMPWIHGIAPRGFASEAARIFSVSGGADPRARR